MGVTPNGECGLARMAGVATSPTLTERLTEVLCRLVNGPAESCQVITLSTRTRSKLGSFVERVGLALCLVPSARRRIVASVS